MSAEYHRCGLCGLTKPICNLLGCPEREPEPSYLCNCGESFREHLARVAHAATCPTMLARRCPSVLPSSADAPHERTGWDGPVRCVLSRDHEGDRHWNSGINWREVVTPSRTDNRSDASPVATSAQTDAP